MPSYYENKVVLRQFSPFTYGLRYLEYEYFANYVTSLISYSQFEPLLRLEYGLYS